LTGVTSAGAASFVSSGTRSDLEAIRPCVGSNDRSVQIEYQFKNLRLSQGRESDNHLPKVFSD